MTMTPGAPNPDTGNGSNTAIAKEQESPIKNAGKCQVVTLWLLSVISAALVAAVTHLEILNLEIPSSQIISGYKLRYILQVSFHLMETFEILVSWTIFS